MTESGLPFAYMGQVFLPNRARVGFDIPYGIVLYCRRTRDIEADATGGTPLAGVLLLDEHPLDVEVAHGWVVNEARA